MRALLCLVGIGLLAAACSEDVRALPVPEVDSGSGPGDGGAPLSSACHFSQPPAGAAATRPVLLAMVGAELRMVRADGTVVTAFRFADGTGVAESRVRGYELLSRGGAAVAVARWTPFDGSPNQAQDVVVLGSDGAVRWHKRVAGIQQLGTDLGPTGALSYFDANRQGLLVDTSGRESTLPGYSPIGGPLADGTIAVRPADVDGVTGLGWLAPDGTTLRPLALPLWTSTGPRWMGDRLAYVGDQGGKPVLVLERPGDVIIRPLEVTNDRARPPQLDIEGGYGLLTSATENPLRQWRIDGATGALTPVEVVLPDGTRRWMFSWTRVDDAGDLLVGARDDYRGGMYLGRPGGGAWSRIGLSVAEALTLGHQARGGTFVITARTEAFGGEVDWKPAPAGAMPELVGDSIQIARPDAQAAYRLPGGLNPFEPYIALSADGKCVAWSTPPRGADTVELNALEVVSRETLRVASVEEPNQIGPMVWMER